MSMGGAPSTQTVTQKTEIPQYQQDYAKENENVARDIAARPYVPYEGARNAPFSGMQDVGFQQVGENATAAGNNQAAYNPAIDAATAGASSKFGSTLNPGSIAPWMSPYIEQALRPQLAAIDRQSAMAGKAINAGATGAGAFGDARTGVQQGENDRNTAELKSNVIGAGYQSAFDRAVAASQGAFSANAGQFNADRTGNLASSDELARVLAAQYGYKQTSANDLLTAGKTQQEQNQGDLTTAYQDFINQQQYPSEMLNLRLATQAGSPYNTTRLTTTPYSPTAQGIGALSALYGLVGKPAGATG